MVLLLVSALAASTLACAARGNAFEAARELEQTSEAQESMPATPVQPSDGQQTGESAGDDGPGDPARGQALFAQQGCAACHSAGENTIVGPGFKGAAVRAQARVAGMTAREYLNQSIREPASFIVPGFSNLMPASFANLPEKDTDDLIAYIESLK
jgi:cytochrome c551/c552